MIKRLAVLPVIAAFAVVGWAAPCWACSCIQSTPTENLERSEVAFTGIAVVRDADQYGGTPIPQGTRYWLFKVESVQKGQVRPNTDVTTADNSAACGVEFVEGHRYQVFATRDGDVLTTNLCSGTAELTKDQKPYGDENSHPPDISKAVPPKPIVPPDVKPVPGMRRPIRPGLERRREQVVKRLREMYGDKEVDKVFGVADDDNDFAAPLAAGLAILMVAGAYALSRRESRDGGGGA